MNLKGVLFPFHSIGKLYRDRNLRTDEMKDDSPFRWYAKRDVIPHYPVVWVYWNPKADPTLSSGLSVLKSRSRYLMITHTFTEEHVRFPPDKVKDWKIYSFCLPYIIYLWYDSSGNAVRIWVRTNTSRMYRLVRPGNYLVPSSKAGQLSCTV